MTNNSVPNLSDWLIASDIDGTLNNKLRRLPPENYAAIRRYVNDCKGSFILASGRSVNAMVKHFRRLDIDNGYAVFNNGAGIYDFRTESVVWENDIDPDLAENVKAAYKKFRLADIVIERPDDILLVRPGISAVIMAKWGKLKIVVYKNVDDVPCDRWCKVIFLGPAPVMKKLGRYFNSIYPDGKNLMASSINSFEVVASGTNKGVAVLKVAEMLGIKKEHTAAIGDYFNDYQMLKSVGFPACCGQAPRALKDISKLVTCHCNKGAVAELIEYIINNHDRL